MKKNLLSVLLVLVMLLALVPSSAFAVTETYYMATKVLSYEGDSEMPYRQENYTFNDDGSTRKIEVMEQSDIPGSLDFAYSTEYFYDVEGVDLRIAYREASKDVAYTDVNYRQDGNHMFEDDVDRQTGEKTTYETVYDNAGRAVSAFTYRDGVKVGESAMTYDKNGRETSWSHTEFYEYGETETVTTQIEYDTDGKVAREVTVDAAGETISESTYSYNDAGQQVKEVYKSAYTTYTAENTYDKDGNLSVVTMTFENGKTNRTEFQDYQAFTFESEPATQFVDVPSDQFYAEPVAWAADNGITTGTDATHFSPNLDCTRGQVVTFLWRAAGCPEPKSDKSPFVDVQNPDDFYYQAVLWAMENGITTGTDATHFAPNDTCTRSQIVTFLWRAAEKPEVETSKTFSDVEQGSFYEAAVAWAVEKGITVGTGEGRFSPNNTCTRGEVVTFLFRAAD